MTELSAGLLLPIDGRNREVGERFVSILREEAPGLSPEKCGNEEPLTCDCRPLTVAQIATMYWHDSFLWTGDRGCVAGMFSLPSKEVHCGPFIYGDPYPNIFDELTRAFSVMSTAFPVDFGWIHLVGDGEWAEYGESDAERMLAPFNRGIFTRDLITGIPNLAWLTILGTPYLDQIPSVTPPPGVRIWRANDLPDGPLFIQLTESPNSVDSDYDSFSRRRLEMRHALGLELFRGIGCNATRIPTFSRKPLAY